MDVKQEIKDIKTCIMVLGFALLIFVISFIIIQYFLWSAQTDFDEDITKKVDMSYNDFSYAEHISNQIAEIDYFDFLRNIDEIPYELRGCAVTHYLENYADQGFYTTEYDFRGDKLFSPDDGIQIRCEDYEN